MILNKWLKYLLHVLTKKNSSDSYIFNITYEGSIDCFIYDDHFIKTFCNNNLHQISKGFLKMIR